ncbi:MAG: hypothetical protein AAFR07_05675 [Pseudomonadota bacterium]
MSVALQLRRATASEAAASNPVLLPGEIGCETDTNRIKVGDGVTAWSDLPYANADVGYQPFEFTQVSATTIWVINHNLNRRPSVTVVDTADETVVGAVVYNSLNTLTITFSVPIAGTAHLV